MALVAGAADVVITPPVGVDLAGYGFGPSVGVLDDLEAQALVLESDGTSAAIVAIDILTVGAELLSRVRERIEATLGIPEEHVLLSASHSHSSPTAHSLRQWGPVDEAYVHALEDHLVGVVTMAHRSAQPARVGFGSGRVENIAENRRGEVGTIDPQVPVVRFDSLQGEPIALLFNYACHPVSLHSYRNLISPDYPGYARSVVRSELGEGVVAMFTLGAAGDINPAGYVAGKTTPQRSRQIGTILGCEVAKAALDACYQDEPTLKVRRMVLDLPTAPLPSAEELGEVHARCAAKAEQLRAEGRHFAEISVLEIKRDWAADTLQALADGRVRRSVPCEILALRIGAAVIVACPLEVFVETGLAIKAASPAQLTIVCSNSNGGVGYLPTADAYERSDYTNPEGLAPKVYGDYALAPGAEPLVRARVGQMLQSMF